MEKSIEKRYEIERFFAEKVMENSAKSSDLGGKKKTFFKIFCQFLKQKTIQNIFFLQHVKKLILKLPCSKDHNVSYLMNPYLYPFYQQKNLLPA